MAPVNSRDCGVTGNAAGNTMFYIDTPTHRVDVFDYDAAAGLPSGRRPLVLSCLDYTERRPHLAGAAGAALHRHFLARAWVVPVGSGRALRVTDEGVAALRDHLRVEPGDLTTG